MVGGKVIEVIKLEDKIYINCIDWSEQHRPDICAIYVERNETSEKIAIGDSLWWQGNYALWTNFYVAKSIKQGPEDVKIPRVGYSGVNHPLQLTKDDAKYILDFLPYDESPTKEKLIRIRDAK